MLDGIMLIRTLGYSSKKALVIIKRKLCEYNLFLCGYIIIIEEKKLKTVKKNWNCARSFLVRAYSEWNYYLELSQRRTVINSCRRHQKLNFCSLIFSPCTIHRSSYPSRSTIFSYLYTNIIDCARAHPHLFSLCENTKKKKNVFREK